MSAGADTDPTTRERRAGRPAATRLEWALVATLTALAAWTRFRNLGALSLSGDEGFTFLAVRGVLDHGVPRLPSGLYYWKSLLYTYLAAPLAGWLGTSSDSMEAGLRFPSALASTVLVPACWWVGRRIHGSAVGLGVATIIALHDWEIEMSRQARYYPVLQLMLVLFLERFHAVHFCQRPRARLGLVACFVLALLSHTIAVSVVLLYGPLIVARGRAWLASRESQVELAVMGVIVLAWFGFESRWQVGFVARPNGEVFGAAFALTKEVSKYWVGFLVWLKVLVPRLTATAVVAAVAWLILGRSREAPEGNPGIDPNFAVLLACTVPLMILGLGLGEAHGEPRYLFFLLPFLALVAVGNTAGATAALASRLGRGSNQAMALRIGAAIAVVIGLAEARVVQGWRVPERRHQDQAPEPGFLPSPHLPFAWDTSGPGRYVARHAGAGDRILALHPTLAFAYVGRLDGWIWSAGPEIWDAYHERAGGKVVDNYVGAPLIRRLEDLKHILTDTPGRVWIIATPSIREPAHLDVPLRYFFDAHADARVLDGRDGISAVYLFVDGHGAFGDRIPARAEIESLPGPMGTNEIVEGASREAARAARSGRDRAGYLLQGKAWKLAAGDYRFTFHLRGAGSEVLMEARDGIGGPVLAERTERLDPKSGGSAAISVRLDRDGAVELCLKWAGDGWVEADFLEISSAAASDTPQSGEAPRPARDPTD